MELLGCAKQTPDAKQYKAVKVELGCYFSEQCYITNSWLTAITIAVRVIIINHHQIAIKSHSL